MSAETLWVALRSDLLPVYMAAAPYDGKSHSSATRVVAFSTSYNEVIATGRYCFVRMAFGLVGCPSMATIPVPPLSVSVVVELSM